MLRSLVAVGEKLTGTTYGEDAAIDLSLRIMADMGISFVYRPVAAKEIAAGKLRQIMIREKFYHTFSCVWSKTSMFAKQYQGIAQDLLKNE